MESFNLELRQFLDLLYLPGALHELRILKKGTRGGYYDDLDQLARDATAQSGAGQVYVTLNPAHPDCRSRILNRVDWLGNGGCTKDSEIIRRSTLLIDCDPVRLAGIPSTDAEHTAALDLAETVRTHLRKLDWPEPIMTDTGNGAGLLYRIDLPPADGGLLKRVLEKLAKSFDSSAVKIDKGVYNAARITRLPGTLNVKGENSVERPHRLARVVQFPPAFTPVSSEHLERLADADNAKPASTCSVTPAATFDVPAWLSQKGIAFTEKSGECHGLKGTWFTLAYCPFKGSQHTDGNTGIFVGDDGQIFAKCHHEKCKDENWRTLRRHLDPDFDARASRVALGDTLEGIKDAHRLARAVLEHFDHPEFRTVVLNKRMIYRWDGIWTPVDDDTIKLLIWRVVKEEFDDFARQMVRCGKQVQAPSVSTALVNNVFGALSSMIEVNASVGDWIAVDGPAASDLLICRNGMLDLPGLVSGQSNSLLPHTPRLFVLNKLDFNFVADAPSPSRWLRFLEEVWPDDLESRLLLQQFFGYALTNDVSHQKYLMLLGATRGGKGVITRLLASLVGKENRCSIRLGNLATRFGLASAIGKSLILVPDAHMPHSDRASEILETLKGLTGGDALDIDRKHLPVVSMALPAKVVMTSNQMINLPDDSRALYERMLVLLFSNSFANNPDIKLDEKLRMELPGILIWAINGWKSLRDLGKFVEPDSSKSLKATLQDSASPIQAFIAEHCVINSRAKADKDELFSFWSAWCKSRDEFAGKKSAFGKMLFEAQPQIKNYRPRIDGKRIWLYEGIGLKEPNADQPIECESSPESQSSPIAAAEADSGGGSA